MFKVISHLSLVISTKQVNNNQNKNISQRANRQQVTRTNDQCPMTKRYSGAYIGGVHLFPFRTEKLSPPEPMVLR